MKRSKRKKFAVTAVFIGSISVIVAFLLVSFLNVPRKSDDSETGDSTADNYYAHDTEGTDSQNDGEHSENVTSKGYSIKKIDGVTYIDNIMIVNKEYPLPESYDPKDLNPDAAGAFEEMKNAAASEGVKLWIQSGYRSYDRQKELYEQSINSPDANVTDSLIARPGYSEHQTGLSMDINSVTKLMGEWKEGIWLRDNCYKYGFIIRYPEDKEEFTGYSYEPWHIRFVGRDLAKKLHDSGECLEEYLGIDSEYSE